MWLLSCTCYENRWECLVWLHPNIICILGTTLDSSPPSFPSPHHIILFIQFTYYNHRFSKEVAKIKLKKYAPLLHTIGTHRWLVTLTTRIKGVIHHSPSTNWKTSTSPFPIFKTSCRLYKTLSLFLININLKRNKPPKHWNNVVWIGPPKHCYNHIKTRLQGLYISQISSL